MMGMLIDPATGDLQVHGGAIAVGDTTAQVTQSILEANPGEFKEFPLLGAGIINLHHGSPDPMWAASARDMLHAAGVKVSKVVIEGETVTVE